MNLSIVAVGKLREPYIKAGVADYLSRIEKFLPIEQIEVPNGGTEATNGQVQNILNREAQALEKALPQNSYIVMLDSRGKLLTSEEFAKWMEDRMVNSVSKVAFVIGGAWGLDKNFAEKSDLKLSLSVMTFPHELARLVLAEQIYRALSLWKNLPYHK